MTIDGVLLLTADVVVHHPWSSRRCSYLARVNRSSVCLHCLQYSGSFYFVYTPDSVLDMADPQTVVCIQTSRICNTDSTRLSATKNRERYLCALHPRRKWRSLCAERCMLRNLENRYPVSFVSSVSLNLANG